MKNLTVKNVQGHLMFDFQIKAPLARSAFRRRLATIFMCMFAMVVVAGCASTQVNNQEQLVTGQLPRPGNILVYDFVATAGDVPADSALAGQPDLDTTTQTDEQIDTGRQLGSEIAAQLVQEIRAMGMPAENAVPGTTAQINDLVIRGYLLSIKEGSAVKRVAIGFGSGASELRTAVEGYQMTAEGLRKLGSGTLDSGGSKGPGAALGLATLIASGNPAGLIVSTGLKVYGEESGRSKVEGRAKQTAKEIGDRLRTRFQEQGWIN
jgi:hypothetical protein